MKQYFINFCIVLFILCIGHIYFGEYNVEKTLLNRNIVSFEEEVNDTKQVSSYGYMIDSEDNKVSLFIKNISYQLVKGIEYIVFVFSQMISMLM
jgi:hypothetical protein